MTKLMKIMIISMLIVASTCSFAAAKSSVRVTISGPNGYIVLASGGALIVGITLGWFGVNVNYSNKFEDPMKKRIVSPVRAAASLVTVLYRPEPDRYKISVPDMYVSDDAVGMSLFSIKF